MLLYFSSILKSDFFRQRFIRINLFLSLFLNLGMWFFLAFKAGSFSDIIYLHYNIYFGIDLIGKWHQVFFFPSLGIFFFIVNFLLGAVVFSQEKILSYFLAFSSSIIQLILILALIFLMVVNL